jgi:hypothetical protein
VGFEAAPRRRSPCAPLQVSAHRQSAGRALAGSGSLRRYLDDLLVDKRGNRQGFPLDILRELFALRAYYDQLHPGSSRPWEVMNNNE